MTKKTLHHEYGHYEHLKQIGLVAYTVTVVEPSIVFYWLDPDNYYSLPWEYIADKLGGVNRGNYIENAETAASAYWWYFVVVGTIWRYLT